MDLDDKEEENKPAQQPLREAATGSGGLFGDVEHGKAKPTAEGEGPVLTPSQHSTEPSQHGFSDAESTHVHQPSETAAAERATGAPPQDVASFEDQPAIAGAQESQEPQQQQYRTPALDPQTATYDPMTQQRPSQVSDQQTAAAATASSSQPSQPPPPQTSYEASSSNQPQPESEPQPQLAEEQDLTPDVRPTTTTTRIPRPQRLRRREDVAQGTLTHKYVSTVYRSSTRPTLPSGATRQYPPPPPPHHPLPIQQGGRQRCSPAESPERKRS